MICSTCRRPLPTGSRTCLRCPKPPAARPATKVPPKPAPADDLLPDEPAPAPSAAGRAASAAAAVPIRPRRRMPLRSGGTGAKATIGGAIAVLLVAGSLGLKVCRVSRGVFGESIENKVVTIPAEGEYSGTLEVSGSHDYTFTVAALDGSVHMGVTRCSGKNPGEKEIFQLVAGATEVAAGRSHTLTGRFSSGYYLWAVFNDSETSSAKAKISFSAR